MNTNNNREDKPRDINPKEVIKSNPAKDILAQKKIDIKESELGRDQSQTPADEHIEGVSQIDKATKKMQQKAQSEEEEYDLNSKELNEEDNRDKNDSTDDWDAEHNRSGRHK